MEAPDIPATLLWDADAYHESGKCPWTIFAYPVSMADERQLPCDPESVRYLSALLAAGATVGVWCRPENQTVYFACPLEERERVESVVGELERQGLFPKDFAVTRCEHLFQLASQSESN